MTLYAQMGDVSEGGAFVKTHAPLPQGERARVRFDLGESGEAFEAEATVMWRQAPERPGDTAGMGLKFDLFDERLREALKRWVQALERLAHEHEEGQGG